MTFWQKFREWLFGLVYIGGKDYPGSHRDVALSVVMAFAALILIVYPTERHPPIDCDTRLLFRAWY